MAKQKSSAQQMGPWLGEIPGSRRRNVTFFPEGPILAYAARSLDA